MQPDSSSACCCKWHLKPLVATASGCLPLQVTHCLWDPGTVACETVLCSHTYVADLWGTQSSTQSCTSSIFPTMDPVATFFLTNQPPRPSLGSLCLVSAGTWLAQAPDPYWRLLKCMPHIVQGNAKCRSASLTSSACALLMIMIVAIFPQGTMIANSIWCLENMKRSIFPKWLRVVLMVMNSMVENKTITKNKQTLANNLDLRLALWMSFVAPT